MDNQDVERRYQDKQRKRYESLEGQAALDPLWRAASAANLLLPHETSEDEFTPDRVADLVRQLGWSQR